MSIPAGISRKRRIELTAALSHTARFLTPATVASALEIDVTAAPRR